MAIDPATSYPGQTDVPTATYPYGCAKNESALDAKDGFPFEAAWVKDLQGFLQGLLYTAGLTPSGAPDTALISQYRQAVQIIADSAAEDAVDDACIRSRVIPLIMTAGSSFFEYYGATTLCGIYQTDLTSGNKVVIPVEQPMSQVSLYANGLIVYLQGATGHSLMPLTKPRVRLVKFSSPSLGVPAPTEIADAYDPQVTVGNYETFHYIQPTFAETALDPMEPLFVELWGESGTNSIVGLRIHSVALLLKRTP